jgi:hypothetical protein
LSYGTQHLNLSQIEVFILEFVSFRFGIGSSDSNDNLHHLSNKTNKPLAKLRVDIEYQFYEVIQSQSAWRKIRILQIDIKL